MMVPPRLKNFPELPFAAVVAKVRWEATRLHEVPGSPLLWPPIPVFIKPGCSTNTVESGLSIAYLQVLNIHLDEQTHA